MRVVGQMASSNTTAATRNRPARIGRRLCRCPCLEDLDDRQVAQWAPSQFNGQHQVPGGCVVDDHAQALDALAAEPGQHGKADGHARHPGYRHSRAGDAE